MFKSAIKTLLGNHHKREAKRLQPLIDEINELADENASLSDEQLRAKTEEFRQRVESSAADLKGEIEELSEKKRHSEDASDRELLSLQIGELESELLETVEDTLASLDEIERQFGSPVARLVDGVAP